MSDALTIAAAVLVGIVAVTAVLRVSLALTDRKPSDELKKPTPDASNVNQDSGIVS